MPAAVAAASAYDSSSVADVRERSLEYNSSGGSRVVCDRNVVSTRNETSSISGSRSSNSNSNTGSSSTSAEQDATWAENYGWHLTYSSDEEELSRLHSHDGRTEQHSGVVVQDSPSSSLSLPLVGTRRRLDRTTVAADDEDGVDEGGYSNNLHNIASWMENVTSSDSLTEDGDCAEEEQQRRQQSSQLHPPSTRGGGGGGRRSSSISSTMAIRCMLLWFTLCAFITFGVHIPGIDDRDDDVHVAPPMTKTKIAFTSTKAEESSMATKTTTSSTIINRDAATAVADAVVRPQDLPLPPLLRTRSTGAAGGRLVHARGGGSLLGPYQGLKQQQSTPVSSTKSTKKLTFLFDHYRHQEALMSSKHQYGTARFLWYINVIVLVSVALWILVVTMISPLQSNSRAQRYATRFCSYGQGLFRPERLQSLSWRRRQGRWQR